MYVRPPILDVKFEYSRYSRDRGGSGRTQRAKYIRIISNVPHD